MPSQGLSDFSPSRRGGLLLNVACNPPRRLTHKQVMELSVADRLLINQVCALAVCHLVVLDADKREQGMLSVSESPPSNGA